MKSSEEKGEVRFSASRLLRLGSEAGWTLFGQAGMAAGAIFAVKILTHFLDPREFGRLMLATTLIQAVSAQVYGPLGQGVMRFWSISRERGQEQAFLYHSLRYNWMLTKLVLALAAVSGGMVLFAVDGAWATLVVLAILVGACTGWSWTRLSGLMAARERKDVAILMTGIAFLKPSMGVVAVLLLSASANWVLVGYLFVTYAGLHLIERTYRKKVGAVSRQCGSVKPPEGDRLGREIVSFSMPFFVWGVFGWIHESCDRWSLQYHFGPDVVGAFSVLGQLAVYPLILISGFLGMLFSPIAYQRAGSMGSGSAMRSAKRLLFFMVSAYVFAAVLLVLGYGFFHLPVVLLVSNQAYAGLSGLLPGLTAAWALYYLGQTLTGYGMLANQPRLYIVPKLAAALVAGALCAALPAWYGPTGILWALGLAGALYGTWCFAIAFRLSRGALESSARSQV